jgi:hypothetical protein
MLICNIDLFSNTKFLCGVHLVEMHLSVEKDAPLFLHSVGMQPVCCHWEEEKRGGGENPFRVPNPVRDE